MKPLGRRAWVAVAGVLGFTVLLAALSGRVGPPRSVRLTVSGMPGVTGRVQVASGYRGELPFSVDLALPVEREGSFQVDEFASQPLPGTGGSLFDGIEPADDQTPAIWWVSGEQNGLSVTVGFEIEAWAPDGSRLEPLRLVPSEGPGVARTILVGPSAEAPR